MADPLVCLVTGCSFPTGFGVRVVRRLCQRRHRVYAGVLDPAHDPAADLLAQFGAIPLGLDVTDDDQVAHAVAAILEANDRIDVVVNNAAHGAVGSIEDTRPSALEHTMAVNLVGPHRLLRRVLPAMRRRSSGVIVNVGSINGFVAQPMLGAYSASKAALSIYTEILAYEVRHFGIRVHLVEPGGFATGIHQRARWEPGGLDPANPYYPLQRAFWGEPDEWTDSLGDPEMVADVIVRAIEEPETPLFLAVAEDTADLRSRMFGMDEQARRAAAFEDVLGRLTW